MADEPILFIRGEADFQKILDEARRVQEDLRGWEKESDILTKAMNDLSKKSSGSLAALGYKIKEVGKGLDKAIDMNAEMHDSISKNIEGLTSDYNNWEEAIKKANDLGYDSKKIEALEEHQARIKSMINMYRDIESELGKVDNELDKNADAYHEISKRAEDHSNAHTRLHNQLRLVKEEMGNMLVEARQSGGTMSESAVKATEEYKKLEKKAADITRSIKEIDEAAKLSASGTTFISGTLQGLQGLVGGIGAIQGIGAMFGNETTELQKIQTRVQGCISAMMGLKAVMTTLSKSSAFSVMLSRMKVAFVGMATGATTAKTAVKALWAALKANPLGLFLTAVTAVVGAFKLLSSSAEDAGEASLNAAQKARLAMATNPISTEDRSFAIELHRKLQKDEATMSFVDSYLNEARNNANILVANGKEFYEAISTAFARLEEDAVESGDKSRILYANMAQAKYNIETAERKMNQAKTEYEKVLKENGESDDEDDIQKVQDATDKYIEARNNVVKEADAFYTTYGNYIKEQSELLKKSAEEAQKKAKERADKIKRLNDEYESAMESYRKSQAKTEQQTQWDIEQISIDAMNDGLAKTLRTQKLNHEKEIAQIEEQENEKIEMWRQLKEKEWAKMNPDKSENKNPYRKKAMYDENGVFKRGSLSEADAADLAESLAVFTTMRENENEKWKQNESDAMRDVLGERQDYVSKSLALERQYQSDRAALVAKGASDEQLALFDSNHLAQQEAMFAELLGDYVGFQQQLTNADEEYSTKRAELEAAANAEADPKKKAALQASLKELEKQYKQTVKNLQQEFIRNNIGDVFNEQTVENIKEAKRALDEMEAMSVDDFNLAYQAHLSADEFESLKKRIREVRNELRGMGKGYSLKDAFSDAFTGKTKKEVQRGVDYIVNGFRNVASVASGIASAMREFAEATGNAKLEKMADTFQGIADTISTAGGYAAAGAQIGGGWGAVIGAVLGIGQGILTGILKSDAQRAEEERQRTEQAHDYLSEVVSGISSLISSVDSLSSTISSLDYTNYRKSLLSAINSLRSDSGFDTKTNWRSLKNGANVDAIVSSGILDDDHIRTILRDYLWHTNGHDYSVYGYVNGLSSEELRELFLQTFRSAFGSQKDALRNRILTQYANQENHKDYELDLRRKALIEEMNALYEQGSLNALEYFNILLKGDQLTLDLLKQKRNELLAQGYSTDSQDIIDIDNQIAEATYSIRERVREMFEGLAGIDIQGIANKWLDIFKEFGDDLATVIRKIDESIDDMIKNIIYHTVFIQPLMQRLNNVINNYQKQLAQQQGINTDVEGWQADVDWSAADFTQIANDMRATGHGIADLWEQVRQQFSLAGLGWGDSANDRSAQARGIATASQDSVDELNGRATTIQGHTFNISENSNIIRDNTNAILGSVRQIEVYTQHLVRMDNDIHNMQIAIGDIQLQGVKIRQN